jgi:tetratricopeptide (TPR) repeat protein
VQRTITNILFFLFISLFSFSAFSQQEEKNKIMLVGRVNDELGKKLEGVSITIKKDGVVVNTSKTSSSGQIPGYAVPMGYIYTYVFSKPGYADMLVEFDTKKGYYPDDFNQFKDGITKEIQADRATMFKSVPNVDYSAISSKPRAKGGFISGNLDWDMQYIQSRKTEIDLFLDKIAQDIKRMDEEFKNLIKSADEAFAAGNYTQALEMYKKASQIKPDDAALKSKIANTEKKIKEKEEEERKQKEFEKLIAEGDGLFAQDKLDEAAAKYRSAQTILPLNKIPNEKLVLVEKRRKELEAIALKAKFDKIIQEADKLLADKKLDQAKTKYQEAVSLKNDEAYPKQQIIKIDQLIAEQKKKEADFAKLVAEGDQQFTINQFDAAIQKYQQALAIFPDKQEVKDKIAKAEEGKRKKEEAERKEKQYTELLASGEKSLTAKQYDDAIKLFQQASQLFSDRPLPKEKIAYAQQLKQKEEEERRKKEQYNALIDKADKSFAAAKYEAARDTYNEALKLFPADAYAKKRYEESLQKIREIEEEKRRLAEIEKKYNDFIAQGDQFKNTEKYNEALKAYESALTIKPSDAVATQRITEVKNILQKIEAERQKRAQYDELITQATRLFNSTDYANAINKYKEASALYPNENYPKEQIKIAEQKLKEKQEEEKRLAEEKKKKEDYDKLIAQADDRYNAASYEEAISFYRKAQAIFPSIPYPTNRITEAERLIRQKAEEDAKRKSQEQRLQEFKRFVEQGDQLVSQQEFEKAKSAYNQALALNDTPEIRKKIQETDKKIAEFNAQKQKELEQKQLDEQYNKLVAEADKAFESGNYQGAKTAYQKALTYKANENYPKNKIKEIDEALAKQFENKNKEFAEQQKRQQFQSFISSGDDALKAKNYSSAINFYKEAQKLYPDDSSVQKKIDEAQKQWDADKNSTASSEVEKKKRAQYDSAIALADKAFTDGDYDRAISKYQEAQSILPSETYPQQQTTLANQKKNELANQNQQSKTQIQYNEFITKANAERDKGNNQSAIGFYQKALEIMPNDVYATNEIKRINDKTASDATNQKYQQIISRADNAFSLSKYTDALSLYEQALNVKNADSYASGRVNEIKAIIEREKNKDQQVVTTQQQTEQTQTTQQTIVEPVRPNPTGGVINLEGYRQVDMTEEEILASMEKSVDDNNYTRPQLIEADDNFNYSKEYNNRVRTTESSNKLANQYENIELQNSEKEIKLSKQSTNSSKDLNAFVEETITTQTNWEEKQRVANLDQYQSNLNNETKQQEAELIKDERRSNILKDYEKATNELARQDNDITGVADLKRGDVNAQYGVIEQDRSQKELENDFRRGAFASEVEANAQINIDYTYSKQEQSAGQNLALSNSYDLLEEKRISSNLDHDDMRILNNEKLTDFNEQAIKIETDRQQKSTALSLANKEAFEDIQTRILQQEIDKDLPRQKVIGEYEKYDDQRTFLFNDYEEKDKQAALQQQQIIDENETKIQQQFLEKDEYRLKANSEFDLYLEQSETKSMDLVAKNNIKMEENRKFFETAGEEQVYKDSKSDERRNRAFDDVKNTEQSNIETATNESSFAQNKTQTINEQLSNNESEKIDNAQKGTASQEKNSTSINAYTDNNVQSTTQKDDAALKRTQGTSAELDDEASKSPTHVSDKMTDNLALKYPQGVTEQRFTTESNGVVTGYAVVRIVVKGNKGDEYKKTVTKNLTRYFKNGIPITEDVWDKETSGPKAE